MASPSAEAARPPVAVRQAWARLIRKIYAADPLVYPHYGGRMQVIAVIEPEAAYARWRPVRPPAGRPARPVQPTARCRSA